MRYFVTGATVIGKRPVRKLVAGKGRAVFLLPEENADQVALQQMLRGMHS